MIDNANEIWTRISSDREGVMAEMRFYFPIWEESACIDYGYMAIAPETAVALALGARNFGGIVNGNSLVSSINLDCGQTPGLVLAGIFRPPKEERNKFDLLQGGVDFPEMRKVSREGAEAGLERLRKGQDETENVSTFAEATLHRSGQLEFSVYGFEEGKNSWLIDEPGKFAAAVLHACLDKPEQKQLMRPGFNLESIDSASAQAIFSLIGRDKNKIEQRRKPRMK